MNTDETGRTSPPASAFGTGTAPTSPCVLRLSMVAALNRALHDAMAEDPTVAVFGQDVARAGGVFRVTDGLLDTFGDRCFDTPLAESAIVGAAVGMALRGLRPVPEIQFDGFVAPAFNQLVSHVAKYRYRTGGDAILPITLRVPSWGGIGAAEHHSESVETYLCGVPGLVVLAPSDPQDAYHLLRDAIRAEDPVVLCEPKRRYWAVGSVDTSTPTAPMHRALVRRSGTHATVVTYGGLVGVALEAAEVAAAEHGWDLEVVDLRCLAPLDLPTVCDSVARTGRAVVLHEAARSHGYGAEVVAAVSEELFSDLEAPILRATGFDTPYPPARMEPHWLPGVERLLDTVERTFGPPWARHGGRGAT